VNSATDLLGLVATTLIGWLIIFDFPAGASREIGVFVALISAMAVAGGAGDYRTLRGAPLFPPIDGDERRAEDDASKSRLAASAGSCDPSS
jgi:hypothetical protein